MWRRIWQNIGRSPILCIFNKPRRAYRWITDVESDVKECIIWKQWRSQKYIKGRVCNCRRHRPSQCQRSVVKLHLLGVFPGGHKYNSENQLTSENHSYINVSQYISRALVIFAKVGPEGFSRVCSCHTWCRNSIRGKIGWEVVAASLVRVHRGCPWTFRIGKLFILWLDALKHIHCETGGTNLQS